MIKKLDLLSPPITLFYLEKRTHTSKMGGILIVLLLLLCSSYIFYLLYLIIEHKKVTSIFYKKFEYDIGKYYLNSSSIYFFLQFHSIDDESYKYKYASKYIRIYSYYGNSDFDESNLDKINHWVYDVCIDGVDNKNLDPNLFKNINNFENSACLKYYYNSKEGRYYNLEEKGFIWPYLAHGTAQKNNVFLHTSIQKCTNDSIINKIFNKCPPQEEIDEYTTKIVAVFLYLVDNQVDPTNFKSPIQQYIQSITSGIGSSESFEETYIFYSPLKVRTKVNSLFEKNNDLESIYFDTNIKISTPNSEKYFKYSRFTHFIQNNIQIYERRYDDIFEILSDIGGIIQCIFNIFYWLNYFYNKYIIISDTNRLFFSVIGHRANSLNDEKIKQLNIKDKNLNDSSMNDLQINKRTNTIIENIIRKYDNNGYKVIQEKNESKESSNSNIIKTINETNKENLNLHSIIQNKKKRKKSFFKNEIKNDYFKENNTNNNIFITNRIKELHYHSSNANENEKKNTNKKKSVTLIQDNKLSDKNHEIIYNNLANQTIKLSQLFCNKFKLEKKTTFMNYFKSICSSKSNNINFLIKYRKSLLSEEHLLKSHLNNIVLEKKLNTDKL